MLHSGLVSVSFRKMDPSEIVSLVARAGLEAIEWGGDIHVPHGDVRRACEVRKMTLDAGIKVASYGSYYIVGRNEPLPFESILETALDLQAPVIRVWAGDKGSQEADRAYRMRVVEEARRIADLAWRFGVTVAFEFHGKTLTDSGPAARRLLEEIQHESVKSYWQPEVGKSTEECLAELELVLPWLANVHAFYWGSGYERYALAEGREGWTRYLPKIASIEQDRYVMLEFVRKDDPELFLQDAATLKVWLEELRYE